MAGRPLTDLTYEQWIDYVFDHAVRFHEPAWYYSHEDWWEPQPQQAIAYLTQLFEAPDPLVEQFADRQIGQGLSYIFNAGDHCRFLLDDAVPVAARVACVSAMQNLFARIFEPRCAPILSHLDESGGNELSYICYMWWDIMPVEATSKPSLPDPIHEACLAVMRDTLKLASPACQESALHGLGHWARAYPEFTAATIDAYLAANPQLRPELSRYAQAARFGCIQ
jgi:hypothetical protein